MSTDLKSLAERLLGNDVLSVEEVESKFLRKEKQPIVTRVAPSPTGFMHIGGVYAALISERLAHLKDGVFFVRIEDTDTSRQVDGAQDLIIRSLQEFGITFDEGPLLDGKEKGAYGPYVQSQRKHIYKAYVKKLLEEGKAYPCFCTPEELDKIRGTQKSFSRRPGYYGEWALHRNLTADEVNEKLEAGLPYVIRLKSEGDYDEKIRHQDLVKGLVKMPENDMDIVILKASGLPTYHFAHAVDDYLMGTTHIVRGDEWLPSVPLHLQLFDMLGFERLQYGHIAPIQKIDDGSKRKLSKRSDPEAAMSYYGEHGYPIDAVLEYLLNLANSNFEPFRKENPDASLWEFPFDLTGLNKSGALLDLIKLQNISKEYIARLSAEEVYEGLLEWAKLYDATLQKRLEADKPEFISIFEIERKGADRARKDFHCWSMVWGEIKFFFDDQFEPATFEKAAEYLGESKLPAVHGFVSAFIANYDDSLTAEEWFGGMKDLAEKHGYAINGKDYKKNPDQYVGGIADAAKALRVALAGRPQTPDLYSIMQTLGKETVQKRIDMFLKTIAPSTEKAS